MDSWVGEKIAAAMLEVASAGREIAVAIRKHKVACAGCGGTGKVRIGGGFSRETEHPCGPCGGKGF